MTPTAELISVTPTRTTRAVVVLCPYCATRHLHGWPYGSTRIGHRVAHCSPNAGGSYLIPTPITEGNAAIMTSDRFRNVRAMTPREFIAATMAEQAEIDEARERMADDHRDIARYRLDQLEQEMGE